MELKTLTPLWTGGVEKGKMDRIHETGIIGSLRWWFELFVRGLGGLVNDPATDKRGGFDPEKYKKSTASDRRARLRDAGLCDASQVFGATGCRRRFRLLIQDSTTPDTSCGQNIRANRSYTDTRGNSHTPTWPFPGSPRSGSFTIQIQSMAQDFPPEVIGGLLQFTTDWAAIGAKAQMGFGVVEPVDDRFDTQPLYEWLIATAGNHQYPRLPSLQNIFLARIQLRNALERDTFNLKYDLRQLFPGQQNRDLRHFIMGTVKGRRMAMAAKVKISRPYNEGLMRVWGWIPEEANVYQGSWNRNTVVDAIYQHLSNKYILQAWRELNSSRDTDTPNSNNAKAFLRSLLGLEENDDAA